MSEEDDVMDSLQAADFLKISKTALRRLVADDKVPCKRIGPRTVRFSRAALTEWLKNGQTPAPAPQPPVTQKHPTQ